MALQDNYKSLQIIKDANFDGTEIVKKFKELLTSESPVIIQFKDEEPIETISILEAIRRYLGSEFSSLTISQGTTSFTLSINDQNELEIVDGDGNLASLSVDTLKVDKADILEVAIAKITNSTIENSIITNAIVSSSSINNSTIANANLQNVTFSGGLELPYNTNAKGMNVGSVLIKSEYFNPASSSNATPSEQVTIPVSSRLWVSGGATPDQFGIRNIGTGSDQFDDMMYFNGSNTSYNLDLIASVELSNGSVSTITYPSSISYVNGQPQGFMTTPKFNGLLLWPKKGYYYQTIGGINAYSIRLRSLSNYNGRIFIARNGGNTQYVYTVYSTNLSSSVTTIHSGIILKPYTAQKFRVEASNNGITETTCLMPM